MVMCLQQGAYFLHMVQLMPLYPKPYNLLIIVRLFLTHRNTTKTLQGRASTIRLMTVTVSAAVSIQSRAVKQVSLQCSFEGVDRLEGADVMRQPVPLQRSGDSE